MSAAEYSTITAADGHEFRAFVASPETGERVPVLILLHEIFGINDYMRTMAHEFAAAGYVAVVPDLFARQEKDVELAYTGKDFDHAIELRDGLDFAAVLADISATLTWGRQTSLGTGAVASLGYCLGGGLAFLASAELDLDCAVSYYGVGVQERIAVVPRIGCPILFHFAENDHYCPADARDLIISAFSEDQTAEFHLYRGTGHAFATYGRNSFDTQAKDLAWERTLGFLKTWVPTQVLTP
ncbi:dienelactone hydrolase family protein [Pseudarthrobacter sp. B4EP4b]|uniref:dienelactone hydrolase family protein n=1 Tax=Pseudarthrobacter sp. B4EP4b TaxID=2590664 RepID=UPI0015EF8CE6|nr:dienelactone hydrolase family protein [Pseudarthrobacter sp. B4EP4b]